MSSSGFLGTRHTHAHICEGKTTMYKIFLKNLKEGGGGGEESPWGLGLKRKSSKLLEGVKRKLCVEMWTVDEMWNAQFT